MTLSFLDFAQSFLQFLWYPFESCLEDRCDFPSGRLRQRTGPSIRRLRQRHDNGEKAIGREGDRGGNAIPQFFIQLSKIFSQQGFQNRLSLLLDTLLTPLLETSLQTSFQTSFQTLLPSFGKSFSIHFGLFQLFCESQHLFDFLSA